MATAKEVPMADDELDALMAELEAETADMVTAPAVTATPTESPPAISDEEIAALEAAEQELNVPPAAAATPAATPEPVVDADAELAALEAELKEPEPTPAPTPAPAPEPEPEPAPTPSTKLTGMAALDAARETVEAECAASAPPASPNPKPTKKSPQLQFFLDVDAFKNDIAVTENNLDNRMMQQAGDFAYHAAELARAEAQHARVKLRFEGIEARIYGAHRKALLDAGEKVTEKMVENAVRVDPEYLAAKNLVIEAEMIVGFNKGAVEALRHRKDMIVQLGADRREEFKGQVRIGGDDAHSSIKERALRAAS